MPADDGYLLQLDPTFPSPVVLPAGTGLTLDVEPGSSTFWLAWSPGGPDPPYGHLVETYLYADYFVSLSTLRPLACTPRP